MTCPNFSRFRILVNVSMPVLTMYKGGLQYSTRALLNVKLAVKSLVDLIWRTELVLFYFFPL